LLILYHQRKLTVRKARARIAPRIDRGRMFHARAIERDRRNAR
jgi:hypothetical protein